MIKNVSHIAIAVPDMGAAQSFYADILGADFGLVGSLPEHGVKACFVQVGHTKIELLEPLNNTSPIKKFLDKHPNGGMHHIFYTVDNINTAIADLIMKGYTPLGDDPKIGAHGYPVIFLHPKETQGTLIELEERPQGENI